MVAKREAAQLFAQRTRDPLTAGNLVHHPEDALPIPVCGHGQSGSSGLVRDRSDRIARVALLCVQVGEKRPIFLPGVDPQPGSLELLPPG